MSRLSFEAVDPDNFGNNGGDIYIKILRNYFI